MDKYDAVIGICRENSRMLNALNREVGEIKAQLKLMGKRKALGYTKVGLFISGGILIGRVFDIVATRLM